MQKSMEVHDLVRSMGGTEVEGTPQDISGLLDKLTNTSTQETTTDTAERKDNASDPEASIFSQLLERIVQSYSIRLEEEGEESDVSLEILLDGVQDSVLITSPAGVILQANHAFYTTFGYVKSELLGLAIFELLPDTYRGAFHERLAEFSMRSSSPHAVTPGDILAFRATRHDGGIVSMDCLLSSIQLRGEPAVLMLIRDLSFDHSLFLQLKESKEHYVALSETITEAIFRLDCDFRIIFANSGIKNTFGWERDEVIGKPFSLLFPPEVFAIYEPEFKKYFYVDDQDRIALGLKRTFEFLGTTKHRGVTPMEMSFGNSKDYMGRTLTCVVRDISQRKTLERKLRHLAYHDKLTGLGNRELFNEDMTTLLQSIANDQTRRSCLLFLDLDGFKHVNDTLGHDAGDELLIETARRIRVCLREHDFAYRFGGDEFVVVLAGIKDSSDGVAVSERILSSVSEPYILRSKTKAAGSRVNVGVSIGVALIPEHGQTLEEVTKSADIAMYCSKEDGKNRYTIFDPTISAKAMERWNIEQEMKSALGCGGFKLCYQPIVGVDGIVRGMEALIRWKRTDGDQVPPSVFIPIAEQNGLIITLGDWVLRRACYDTKRLHDRGHDNVYVSVNVSSIQFEQPNYIDNLENIVRNSGLSPSRLKLEITESAIMRNTKNAIERIKEIKQRLPGIAFMVDDFGTGYSSLAYLSRLPIDALKIDISFVMHLAELQNEKVVNAIINLGHSLDLDIVAEGIETVEQWNYFEERKCGALQGYFFMKAAEIDEVCDLINRGAIKREVVKQDIVLEAPSILVSRESMSAIGLAAKAAMAESSHQGG